MSRLTPRRVRRLRRFIQSNRCPSRPGLSHSWVQDYGMDPMSAAGVIHWWRCEKCGEEEW